MTLAAGQSVQWSRPFVRGQLEGTACVSHSSLTRMTAIEQLLPWVAAGNEPSGHDSGLWTPQAPEQAFCAGPAQTYYLFSAGFPQHDSCH